MESKGHFIDLKNIEFNYKAQEVIVPIKVIYDAKTWAKQEEFRQIISPRGLQRASESGQPCGELELVEENHQTQLQRLMDQSRFLFKRIEPQPQLAIENNNDDHLLEPYKTPKKSSESSRKSLTCEQEQEVFSEKGEQEESKFIACSESSINSKDLII